MNIGIIPARLDSKRLPKKILADLNGKPLVVHTIERALQAKRLDRVIVAIDSEETREKLKEYDYEIFMTSSQHLSGTDRVAEVVRQITEAKIIINIQADEPMIDPAIIDSLVDVFDDKGIGLSTIVSNKLTVNDLLNPNIVKAFIDIEKNAIDFKRNIFDLEIGGVYRHIGIYGFSRETLFTFTELESSDREKKHNLEQLRAIDNNIPIHTIITNYNTYSVDTQDDLDKVAEIMNDSRNLVNDEEK